MAVSYVYSGNVYKPAAGTTSFALTSTSGKSIKYLEKSDISVATSSDSGGTWTTLTRPAQWDFDTAGTSAVLVTGTTAGDWVRVLRTTPFDDRYTTFAESSLLTSDQLNDGEDFSLYVDQELYDQVQNIDGSTGGAALKKITGVLPVEVDVTKPQEPEISVDLIKKADAEKDPTNPTWETDDKLASPAAIDRIYKQIVGDGVGFPGAGNKAKLGQLRVDNTKAQPEMFFWDANAGTPAWVQIATQGPKGDQGEQGIQGPPPGLQSPAADATNVPLKPGNVLGDATAAVTADSGGDLKFSFGVPVGQKGDKGDTSDPVVISQDTQPTFGDDVVWFNTVNAKAYFGYTDPDGDQYWVCISIPGPQGPKGDTGAGPPTTVADTAPNSPGDGYVWHNSHNGRGYVYWSSQGVWVEM